MSDDWKPGDLALCVKRGPWEKIKAGGLTFIPKLVYGSVHTVERVANTDGDTWLAFGPVGTGLFRHSRFVKINPLTDEERDEFLSDLERPVRTEA